MTYNTSRAKVLKWNFKHGRFFMAKEQFILDYEAAFRAANPGKDVPVITKSSPGWYLFRSYGFSFGEKKRRSNIEAMTERLLKMVENSDV